MYSGLSHTYKGVAYFVWSNWGLPTFPLCKICNLLFRFEEINFKHLTNITHKHMLEDDVATHVVTAVLYGVQAVFLFESHGTSYRESADRKASLKAHVKDIFTTGAVVGAGGETIQYEDNLEATKHIRCSYFGDIELKENPTTFQDAIRAYKTLPEMFKDELAVPVKVWLYPLSKLTQSTVIYQEIPSDIAREFEAIIKEMATTLADVGNLQKQRAYQMGLGPVKAIKDFHTLAGIYGENLKMKLRSLVCDVRKCEKNCDALRCLL